MMDKSLGLCQECESGNLLLNTYNETFQHNGKGVLVTGLEYGLCESCGADPVLVDQVRSNQKKITDAKRESLGLLSGDQIKTVREFLGLTQQDAAGRLGGGANGFSKYERGETVQSIPMDKLLRVLAKHPEHLESVNYTPEEESFLFVSAGIAITSAAEALEGIIVDAIELKNSVIERKINSAPVLISEEGWHKNDREFTFIKNRSVA